MLIITYLKLAQIAFNLYTIFIILSKYKQSFNKTSDTIFV